MHVVNWITFCISGKGTQATVHFFPASPDLAAPYLVRCKLTLFGTGLSEKSVVLDGARLSQPDGVRLGDAFPFLNETQDKFYGLDVEITSLQPRVDLSASSCIIELKSAERALRFRPSRPSQGVPRTGGLCIRDPFNTTSLVMVNSGSEPVRPGLTLMDHDSNGKQKVSEIGVDELAPGSVREVILKPIGSVDYPASQGGSAGLLRSMSVYLQDACQGLTTYLLYRDARHGRPLSVIPI